MTRIVLKAATGTCRIHAAKPVAELRRVLRGRSCAVVMDRNVRRFHGGPFRDWPIVEIGTGERAKTLRTVERVYERFLELGLDRSSWVVGVGGGIVCDVAAFAAATFLRGLRFGLVPTTLVAQADASIGGKNGVNIHGFKNMVGTFRQPDFVWLDHSLLGTLPAVEIRCGAAEVVKHGLIARPSLFSFLEREWRGFLGLDQAVISRAVLESIEIKSAIVGKDEKENGRRRILNFGHTVGHALERTGRLRHGEAVSIGMVLASRISAARGMIAGDVTDRVENLLRNLGLPTRVPDIDFTAALHKDKKRRDEEIRFVLLAGIGRAEVVSLPIAEIKELIHDMRQHRNT